jgi:hypothetical protein
VRVICLVADTSPSAAFTDTGATSHAATVVVSKHSWRGSPCQATRMRGGTASFHAASPGALRAVAVMVMAGWALASIALRSSGPLVMSLVASTCPLVASRTVRTTDVSSPDVASCNEACDHVARPTPPSQRCLRRSSVLVAPRLEQGEEPFGSTLKTRPGSPRPITQEPSNAVP